MNHILTETIICCELWDWSNISIALKKIHLLYWRAISLNSTQCFLRYISSWDVSSLLKMSQTAPPSKCVSSILFSWLVPFCWLFLAVSSRRSCSWLVPLCWWFLAVSSCRSCFLCVFFNFCKLELIFRRHHFGCVHQDVHLHNKEHQSKNYLLQTLCRLFKILTVVLA